MAGTLDPREELIAALIIWLNALEIPLEDFTDDIVISDNEETEVNDALNMEETLSIALPECEYVKVTYREFIDYAQEIKTAKLTSNLSCITDKRYMLRVSPSNSEAYQFLSRVLPDPADDEDFASQSQFFAIQERINELKGKIPDSFGKIGVDIEEDVRQQAMAAMSEIRDAYSERSSLLTKIKGTTQRYCLKQIQIDGQSIGCSLTQGFSMFGVLIAIEGDYTKHFPPVIEEDLFVEIIYGTKTSEDTITNIVEAYLFELSSSLGMDFEPSQRPTIEDDYFVEGYEDKRESVNRLRPLLIGKGMKEVLRIYNQGIATSEVDIRILFFTKVIEFISQTVVRLQFTETVRAKLLSRRALDPDATYISELVATIEEQRVFSKDRESVRLTVMTCCDATELSRQAPRFLKELANINSESKKKDKDEALFKLGSVISATRNSIAHAKANYQPTGDECPENAKEQFASCLKIAVQQVIRWYHAKSDVLRVV